MRFWDNRGHYDLEDFPGCSAAVVSTHAFIKKEHRGKGNGQAQHKERLFNAARMGYSIIVCTVRSDNTKEKHILEKNGWKHYDTFYNPRTESHVELWGRVLDPPIP